MRPYNNLFWGFLFMFDLRLNGIDFLPDFIGYLLFYKALTQLADQSIHYLQAKEYVIPIIFVSLFDLYQPQAATNFSAPSLILMIFSLILIILDLLIVYNICRGIMDLSVQANEEELEVLAQKRWKAYFYLKISFVILLPLMLMLRELSIFLFIPYFIFSIIVIVWMMRLMRQAERTFELEQY